MQKLLHSADHKLFKINDSRTSLKNNYELQIKSECDFPLPEKLALQLTVYTWMKKELSMEYEGPQISSAIANLQTNMQTEIILCV